VIIHENVGEFPLKLLRDAFGDLYLVLEWCSVVLSLCEHGQANDRVRRISILFHKRCIVVDVRHSFPIHWKDFVVEARRTCSFDWTAYFRATEEVEHDREELLAEIAWALDRRSMKGMSDLEKASRCHFVLNSKFDEALNNTELAWRDEYLRQLGAYSVCSLGQDPFARPCSNWGARSLHTIIRKPELMYSHIHHRWLTPQELALVHNLPMAPRDFTFLHFGAETSFSRDREAYNFPPRRRNDLKCQIGNGMGLCCLGIAWSYVWMCLARLQFLQRCAPTSSLLLAAKRLRLNNHCYDQIDFELEEEVGEDLD